MKEIRDFFDGNAENWDKRHHKSDFDAAELIVKKTRVSRGDRVLDVGGGTGIVIPFLKKAEAEITVVDISSGMLKIIKRKFPDVKTVCADFENEELFKSESFKAIIAYNVFPHLAKPQKAVMNAFKFLKKGGIFIIGHSMNREKLDLHHKKAGGIVANHTLMPNVEIKKVFVEAGFRDIKIEEDKYFFAFGSKLQ